MMLFRFLLIGLATLVAAGNLSAQTPMPPFRRSDRIVIIAPHPDDEVLATGGVIQQAVAAGAEVRVLYLTNGDHNQIAFKLYSGKLLLTGRGYQRFGEKRVAEAIAATGLLGLRREQLTFLGYPDWGLLPMWRDCWADAKPFRSDATRVSAVPYKDSYSYEQPYRPELLLADLKTLLAEFRPTMLFAPHPADTNPDHRAVSVFVRLALLELQAEKVCPQMFYYVVHFGDWPKPYHYHPEVVMSVPSRLAENGQWHTLALTPRQTEIKYRAILENASQLTTRQFYLEAFARANELFASLPTERISLLPSDARLDWKQAVRNRSLAINTQSPSPKLNGQHSTDSDSISLKNTAFLRQGDDLIVAVDFHNRLGPRSNVHLFLYGYQRAGDFAGLPKIHINVNPLGHVHVYDDDRKRITEHGVTMIRLADKLILRVPMSLLGGLKLDHVFTATRANLGQISADDTAWKLYELPSADFQHTVTLEKPNG